MLAVFGFKKQLPRLNINSSKLHVQQKQGHRSHLDGPDIKGSRALFLHLRFEHYFSLILDTKKQHGRGKGGEGRRCLADVEHHAEVVWLQCQAGSGKRYLMEG